ncbi:hypothetical protein F4808DRAFT_435298, partial [Astrocystis sublimbata]
MQTMIPRARKESALPDPVGASVTSRIVFSSSHTAQPTCTIYKTPQSQGTAVEVTCPTRGFQLPTRSIYLVTRTDRSSSVTPMARPRPSDSVRAIIESAIPNTTVEAISIIPTRNLLRTFRVQLADKRTLLLNLPPSSARLLRSERSLLQSEAAVLGWLLDDVCQHDQGSQRLGEKKAVKCPIKRKISARWPSRSSGESFAPYDDKLFAFLPDLITQASTPSETSPAFNLLEPTPGESISGLGGSLTHQERRSVDFQKGQLMRRIANVTSPTGKFGQPCAVLRLPGTPEDPQRAAGDSKPSCTGVDSWREAFHLLLEGALRDGEDLAVTMSYEKVRTTFHKFSHLLDAVTTPRLVVCSIDDDEVVLVTRSKETPLKREQGASKSQKRSPNIKSEPDDSSGEAVTDGKPSSSSSIKVTGLRDWSNCIFGDPLFAPVFSYTTPEFGKGFGWRRKDELDTVKQEGNEDEYVGSSSSSDDGSDDGSDDDDREETQEEEEEGITIVEDPDNAPIRILLYEC